MKLAKTMQASKRTCALMTAFALALSPSTSIMAQSQLNGQKIPPAQSIDRINKTMPSVSWPQLERTWETMSRGRNRILSRSKLSLAAPMEAAGFLNNDKEMRDFVLRLSKDPDKAIAQRGTRLLTWLDIASAKSREERHEMIRRLPVSIIESKLSEDLVQKDFVIRGKVVRRAYVATATRDHASGPSAFNCYDDEPEPCLTQQEQDDLIIFVANAEDEAASMQAELDQEWAEYEAYCNTWGCEDEDGTRRAHGPSDHDTTLDSGCVNEAVIATVGGIVAVGEILDGMGILGAAAYHEGVIAMAHAIAIADGITIGVGIFAYGLYNFIQCKRAKVRTVQEVAVGTAHDVAVNDRFRQHHVSLQLASSSLY